MAQAPHATPLSPDRIMDSLMGFQLSSVLKGAIELDLFTAIADGNSDCASIAKATGASDKGTRVMCDYLTIRGLLNKSGQSYALAPDSEAFLNKKSPMYLGSISFFLASDEIKHAFADVAGAVRKGGTVKESHGLTPEHPMWVDFARSMMPMMMLPANLMAVKLSQEPVTKILDVAASHGAFGILLAQQNPEAKLVASDWAPVLEFTRENAQKFGVGDRFSVVPGSVFDAEIGSNYDVILLPNFLHHFDHATNVVLLKKMRAALKPGGRVAIGEFVPNQDRVSPPFPAMFSMMMLGSTPNGDAYTEEELKSMLTEAGLEFVDRTDLLPSPMTLVIGRNS